MDIRLKRAYDEAAPDDGFRALIDGLWPRGVSREQAAIDAWLKELAPSPGLRRWFGHDPAHWRRFRSRYRSQLRSQARSRALEQLAERARQGPLTLIYAARDTEHNNAVVVAELLR